MIDFLVIGGGIAGLSAGARLSEHGQVLLLEAEKGLGYHTSGRSAALYEPDYGLPANVALSRASGDYFHSANTGYLSPRGLLLVADRDQELAFRKDVETLLLEPISPASACDMVPILDAEKLAFAAYHDTAQDIDTDLLMQDFARVIRANGGRVQTGCAVEKIARQSGGWCVEAGKTQYVARNIVNAAGSWADEIAIMAGIGPIGITPYRRSMARLPAPGENDVANWPVIMGANESWYAKPDAGKLLVSPAEEDPSHPHDAFADDMVLAEGLARYQNMVTEPITRVETNWAGLRSFAPDRVLVLGPDPDYRDFIWCAGQGGYGFQTAPAASQLLADLVTGGISEMDNDVIRALAPERFRK